MIQPIRSGGGKNKKTKFTSKQRRNHRGGAIYSFDYTDVIGGLPAVKSLYKTTDSDCPMGGVNDPKLGYMYYDPLTSHKGGSRKLKKYKRSKLSKRTKHTKRSKKH